MRAFLSLHLLRFPRSLSRSLRSLSASPAALQAYARRGRGIPGRRLVLVALILLLLLASSAALFRLIAAPVATRASGTANGKMPLYFVENHGQTDARVAYSAHSGGVDLFFTPQGVTYALATPGSSSISSPTAPHLAPVRAAREAAAASTSEATGQRWAVAMEFVGANSAVRLRGEERTPTVVSYFRGPQPQWKIGLPTYQRVVYANLWPGIDLIYEGTVASALEYSFLIRPGADPGQIRLAYRGATTVTRTPAGQLEVMTPLGGWTEDAPYAYQDSSGGRRTPIAATHVLAAGAAGQMPVYGFALGAYDHNQPLVLDPVVFIYSGYIGGADFDSGNGIAVDQDGYAYITGQTASDETTFPVTVGPDLTYNGSFYDAFVAKVKADGSGLVWAGYIGGAGGFSDVGQSIAVDQDGNAYIAGTTYADETTFPVTVGPDLTFNGGFVDAFVAEVRRDGQMLLYCGYIGGADDDVGNGIALDKSANAYVTGQTSSDQASFPVTVGPDLTFNGMSDAFVAKVTPTGKELAYAGYIGGAELDNGEGVAVDGPGNAYVTGQTYSDQASFPVTVGPDLTYNDIQAGDAFVAKVDASGKLPLIYAGYIGGANQEDGRGIAVDGFGNAYVTGLTLSGQATFPETFGPDLSFNGISDAFVAKVDASGNSLLYCGYIGGEGSDLGLAIAVGGVTSAYVTGSTFGAGFPLKTGPDLTFNGAGDAFVTKIAKLVFVPVPLPILIQPGSSLATLNPDSRGELPVAILSTAEFDATVDVDLASVRFGAAGTEAASRRATRPDVNEDGLPDLLLHFAIPDTGIACGATSAALSGRTVDGQEIRGSAPIQTVGCSIRR